MRREPFDVSIIGGGPAGCAAAISLASSGWSVAVVERSNYDSVRIGETIGPDGRGLLESLGVWTEFVKDEHLESPGNVSIWGDNNVREHDFLFDPKGCGWHLDRARFDCMLAKAADERGADVLLGTSVKNYRQEKHGNWILQAERSGEPLELESRYLVLATGRRAAMRLPFEQKNVLDRLIGVVRMADLNDSGIDRDHRTLVEAAENGWWYSSVLPQGKMVTAFMTDADLLPRDLVRSEELWRRQLTMSPFTFRRFTSCGKSLEARVFAANSYLNVQSAGKSWVAIGDLASAFDPLSSEGVVRAMKSGMDTARRISDGRKNNHFDVDTLLKNAQSEFDDYLHARTAYYSLEQRWRHSPFWRRRFLLNRT